jgi:two-component system sensor histidine kinase BaeS
MLLVSLMLIGGIMLAAQWRFTQGLRHYVQQEEVERAEFLVNELADFYATRNSWDMLRNRPGRWVALLRQAAFQLRQEQEPLAQAHESQTRELAPQPASDRRASPALVNLMRRLLLMDAAGTVVVGNADLLPQAKRLPIVVHEQTVGWLGIAPPKLRGDTLRDRLLHEQTQGLLWIGLLALLLAGTASALLARYFLQPIRRMNLAAQGLAQGDLSCRVALQRDDELGQLASQFDRMAQALEHQERDRRTWLADVSHELRTPLTILKGEIEALQDGVRPLDMQALASLRQETERLDRLINDLYQLAQADRGAFKHAMQPLVVNELVHSAAERFRERLRQSGLTFELHCASQSEIWGDPQRLHQVLANLLENSARYTQAPGRVRLSCQQTHNEVVLTLEDSAPGVPAEAMPRLFERLYRVETSRSREHGGSGLGLAMCRAIVQTHGGQLEAFPSTLGGLGLHLSLPLRATLHTEKT